MPWSLECKLRGSSFVFLSRSQRSDLGVHYFSVEGLTDPSLSDKNPRTSQKDFNLAVMKIEKNKPKKGVAELVRKKALSRR